MEESEEETDYSSSESEPEILPDSARRSRRPVEKYQVIHDYRGSKNQWGGKGKETSSTESSRKVGRPRKQSQDKTHQSKSSEESPEAHQTQKTRQLSVNSPVLEKDKALPPVEDDVRLIKEATVNSPKDPLPDLLANATRQRRRSSSATEDTPPPIVSGRRRLCQTNFYQVAYPQPKRRKSVDTPVSKKSEKKQPQKSESSASATPSKGWRGKSNLLDISSTPASNKAATPESPKPKPDEAKPVNASKASADKKVGRYIFVLGFYIKFV